MEGVGLAPILGVGFASAEGCFRFTSAEGVGTAGELSLVVYAGRDGGTVGAGEDAPSRKTVVLPGDGLKTSLPSFGWVSW